ncbi:LysR family transcriptional regulator [Pseudomonas gingeri]|uniref:LysR family transcriptional regulator n=1 Tax=Pseudomonas gingeri TaxID=117681 RepID=UPI0015A11B5D|nr:LysR family transcriptional regulator [Pseudomonas gingeri]NWA29046.1 LysR family transcriptional regulator [Pseudomonas gingeri]NWD73514.1 LysR family transcriptional regulator [Pseudomonas gingeri]
MDNLGDIRLFVEAAQLGGLSAAGRKLGLSPAAASARLLKLETSLATRLFERTTRQLRLTDEGRLYLQHCRQALQALDDARAALSVEKKEIRGKIRLSATSDFGRHVLSPWLDAFTERYPQVVPALLLSDSLSHLVSDDVDLVIRFGVPPDSSLIARPLAANRRVLCAAPSYLQRKGTPEHPEQLGEFDHIVAGQSGWSTEWRLHRGKEEVLFKVPLDAARETNDGALARQWAIAGHGIVLKSIWDVSADLAAGRLSLLLPEWQSVEAPVHALYPRSRYLAPRVRALLDFLLERFEQASREMAV